jgi:hypothetical protein
LKDYQSKNFGSYCRHPGKRSHRWLTISPIGPDMQNAIRRLMRPDEILETFSELAVKEPDLMRMVLQASVAALVNVQSVEAVDAEMRRRAVKGN